jgi:hypothetical protein
MLIYTRARHGRVLSQQDTAVTEYVKQPSACAFFVLCDDDHDGEGGASVRGPGAGPQCPRRGGAAAGGECCREQRLARDRDRDGHADAWRRQVQGQPKDALLLTQANFFLVWLSSSKAAGHTTSRVHMAMHASTLNRVLFCVSSFLYLVSSVLLRITRG